MGRPKGSKNKPKGLKVLNKVKSSGIRKVSKSKTGRPRGRPPGSKNKVGPRALDVKPSGVQKGSKNKVKPSGVQNLTETHQKSTQISSSISSPTSPPDPLKTKAEVISKPVVSSPSPPPIPAPVSGSTTNPKTLFGMHLTPIPDTVQREVILTLVNGSSSVQMCIVNREDIEELEKDPMLAFVIPQAYADLISGEELDRVYHVCKETIALAKRLMNV